MNLWDYEKRKKTRNEVNFKKSNKVWNKYHLNKRENIGHTMVLIKESKPKTFEEWEKYYEESGKQAQLQKNNLTFKSFKDLKDAVYVINCTHGKTQDDLLTVAEEFQECLKKEGLDFDLETCFNYVYIRAVDETFIGYEREMAAQKHLDHFCDKENLTCKETSTLDDVRYGVDFEIFKDDKLIAGIQVKGSYYKEATEKKSAYTAIAESDQILHDINAEYTKLKKVPVLQMYITPKLKVLDKSIYDEIRELRDKALSLDNKLNNINSSTSTPSIKKNNKIER